MNAFRTTLSLLGVTVGIFAIIGVFTVVDSLEKSIRDSLNFLGTGTIYVQKWPFTADESGEYNWWDFWNRPNPSYNEFKFLEQNLKSKSSIAIWSGDRSSVMKYKSNSYDEATFIGGSYLYNDIFTVPIGEGRYFTQNEVMMAKNVAIIGANIAESLFTNESALGKTIKVRGQKYFVIGVIEKEGESFMGFTTNDENFIVPYESFRKIFNTGTGRQNEKPSTIAMKGYDDDIGLVKMEYELKGLLRTRRGLRPKRHG